MGQVPGVNHQALAGENGLLGIVRRAPDPKAAYVYYSTAAGEPHRVNELGWQPAGPTILSGIPAGPLP